MYTEPAQENIGWTASKAVLSEPKRRRVQIDTQIKMRLKTSPMFLIYVTWLRAGVVPEQPGVAATFTTIRVIRRPVQLQRPRVRLEFNTKDRLTEFFRKARELYPDKSMVSTVSQGFSWSQIGRFKRGCSLVCYPAPTFQVPALHPLPNVLTSE